MIIFDNVSKVFGDSFILQKINLKIQYDRAQEKQQLLSF